MGEGVPRAQTQRMSFPCTALSLSTLSAFHCPSPCDLCFVLVMASHEEMAPRSSEKLPPTRALGYSHVTPEVLEGMILNGLVDRSQVRALSADQSSVRPEPDEVVVFRDFFTAGLRFPLDPVIVEIFRLHGVYFHQMTPTSFVRLNLFMWLAKTGKVEPQPKPSLATSASTSSQRRSS